MMKNHFSLLALLLIFSNCKKEHKTDTANNVTLRYYKQAGFTYITTIQCDSNELIPYFAGKIPHQDAYKIIYSEKIKGSESMQSFILDKGVRKPWVINFEKKYCTENYSQPYLSKDGSYISDGEYYSLIEKKENEFSKIDKHPLGTWQLKFFKLNDRVLATISNFDNSELDKFGPYQGNQYRNVDLLSDYDGSSNFNIKHSFIDKLWNYEIIEYNTDNLLFAYTKDDKLFAALLNSDFQKTVLDDITCNTNYKHGGCDGYTISGKLIKIINNGESPYIIVFGGKDAVQCYQLKNNKLMALNIKTPLNVNRLFACMDNLYTYANNSLQRLDMNEFKPVDLPNFNILGIYGSEEEILLAIRKKEDTRNNYIDIVQFNP